MLRYLVRRLIHSIVVLFVVSLFVFFVVRLSGDPAALMLPLTATSEDVEVLRRSLGLDRPIVEQYVRFLANAVRGDLGMSLWQKQPTFTLIMQRLPATLELAGASMLLATALGVPLGVLAALNRRSPIDRLATIVAVISHSVPGFWLGILMILVFAVDFGWLPSSGRGTLAHLLMPAAALSTLALAQLARLTRSGMIEVLGQDYIRTARAKGLPRRLVIARHALRNTAVPLVTVVALQIGVLLGGAVVIETVFSWPGIGQLAFQAVTRRDFPLIQATVLFIGTMVLLANLLADLACAALDPRIRIR